MACSRKLQVLYSPVPEIIITKHKMVEEEEEEEEEEEAGTLAESVSVFIGWC